MTHVKEVVVFAPLFNKLPIEGYGGIERITISRVKYLRRAGFKVQLVANTSNMELADSVVEIKYKRKFPITTIKSIYWLSSLRWTRYVSSFTRLKKEIWDSPILCDAGAEDILNNFLFAKTFGLSRFVFFLHGNFYLTNGIGRYIFKPIDNIFKVSYKMNYGALNTHLNSFLLRKGFKSNYTPNGIEFQPISQIIDEPANYLLFIGGINRNKAPHLAIKVAQNLKMKLEIVGPIQDMEYFKEKVLPWIGDKIIYRGELPNEDKINLLRESKALLFTSQWNDPQPTVILEALSYGVPVLSLFPGHYSGVYDIIENGKNGYLGSIDDLLEKSEEIFQLNRKEIYLHTKTKWSWDNVIMIYHSSLIEKLGANI